MPFLLLGSLAVTDDHGRSLAVHGAKARALLALLLTRANAHVATDQLEDELWDGEPPRAARATVQAHVCRLRSLLKSTGGSATISGGSGGYMLAVDDDEIDVRRFETTAVCARNLLDTDPHRASDLFARALDHWRGPALQDVRHLPRLCLEAHRLDELHLTAIEGRIRAELAIGGHVMAVSALQRLVEDHPYREELSALLMLALYRSGRQVEALRCFRSASEALEEIGLVPGRELRDLESAIIREDPALGCEPAGVVQLGDARRVVLIAGPRANERVASLVADACTAGVCVLRARAGGPRPYEAIADALAPLLAEMTEPARRKSLAPIIADVPPASRIDPAFQRLRAFEAVSDLLQGMAIRQSVLLVIEDVDRAGASTLDLLEHLARQNTAGSLSIAVSRTNSKMSSTLHAWMTRLERSGLLRRDGNDGDRDESCEAAAAEMAEPWSPPLEHAELAARAFGEAALLSARAGDDAYLRLGFDEAAQHYRAALAAIDLQPEPQILRRAELLIALGRACHASYQLDAALDAFRRAAAYGAQIGDINLVGEAAVGVATATEFAMADDTIAELLSSTLKVLPAEAPVRVELLAGVARSLPRNDPAAIVTARHAVDLARRLAAPRQVVIALATSILVTWGPQDVSQRLADIDEVIERAEHLEWIELAVEARGWRAATLQQLGRDREALAETAIVHSWAERARRPFFLALASMHTIAAHLRSGSTAAADAALADLPSGADASPNFSAGFAAQLFLLRRQQGRLHDFVPLLDALVDDDRAPSAWDAARVVALAETGSDSARAAMRVAVARLADVPRDWLWLATVALLADACIHLADDSTAGELHHQLSPHRDEIVVVAHGVASLGPVAARLEALGRLASGVAPAHESDSRLRQLC